MDYLAAVADLCAVHDELLACIWSLSGKTTEEKERVFAETDECPATDL